MKTTTRILNSTGTERLLGTLCLVLTLIAGTASAQDVISTVAGNGAGGFKGGDVTLPGPSSELHEPSGLVFDAAGNLYIADVANGAIRRLDTAGMVSTIAGNGDTSASSGDGGLAIDAQLKNPVGVDLDAAGNIYIADAEADVIRRIDAVTANISTIAGDGTPGSGGDGGQAIAAQFDRPTDVLVDATGNLLYIADRNNHVVRVINLTTGVITKFAGTGTAGDSGDTGPAAAALLRSPAALARDAAGNIYISDAGNQKIRMVDTLGDIDTVAGTGTSSYTGDGGPATAATFNRPRGIGIDGSGNIYVADNGNEVIRIFTVGGNISTLAGTGNPGFSGDYGPPNQAELNRPYDVAISAAGDVFIADAANNRVRKIAPPTANNVPTDITLTKSSFVRSASPNQPIGGLSADDADGGDNHFFTIAPGIGDTDNSLFTIFTGNPVQLRVRDSSGMALGNYSVRVQADDYNGGVFSKSLTVTLVEDGVPVITLTGDNPLLIEAGNPFVDPGATATDTVDDDATLTANIVVDDSAVDILTPGDYPVTYDVTDSEGNAADTVTRTVTITPDVTPPVILLNPSNPQIITVGNAYTELGATATDLVDDDATLTAAIVIDASAVDTATAGNYSVTYDVTDTAGNMAATVTRTVTVQAAPPPPPPPPPPPTSSGGGSFGLMSLAMLLGLLGRRRRLDPAG